jgi:RimJ/RimL family protein N-acetyltransferase
VALREDTVEQVCTFWRLWAEEPETINVNIVTIGSDRFCRAPEHLQERLTDPPGELNALVDVLGDDLEQVRGAARLAYGDAGTLRLPEPGRVEPVADDDKRLATLARASEPFEWAEASIDEPAEYRLGLVESKRLVALATLHEWYDLVGHIGVFTRAKDRGRGLGGRVAAGVTQIALDRNLVPQWRSRMTNAASAAVADRLGFEAIGTQLFVRVRRES